MSGRTYVKAGEQRSRRGDWIWLTAADGSTFSLPRRWTSASTPDPFEQFAQGRAHFRLGDLVELVDLVSGLESFGGEGRASRDV